MSDHPEDISRMADDLSLAGRMLSDETGEYWTHLAAMAPYIESYANHAFIVAWEQETKDSHASMKEDYRFVTYTEAKPVTRAKLVHIDDMEDDQ